MKSTAEKILDIAEDLFAERGYDATSLGEVADRVGIRSPSLYNHFRNKDALYIAVIERLMMSFAPPLQDLLNQPVTRERVLHWLEKLVYAHHDNPNFARLVQHAALSGDQRIGVLIERLIKPMINRQNNQAEENLFRLGDESLQPWAVMALNNMLISYVTMAPLHRDILGIDPMSQESLQKHKQMMLSLASLVMGEDDRKN